MNEANIQYVGKYDAMNWLAGGAGNYYGLMMSGGGRVYECQANEWLKQNTLPYVACPIEAKAINEDDPAIDAYVAELKHLLNLSVM